MRIRTISVARGLAALTAVFPGRGVVGFHTPPPLRYWLAGGLKRWTLLPGWGFPLATFVGRMLAGLSRQFCSFVDIELRRK